MEGLEGGTPTSRVPLLLKNLRRLFAHNLLKYFIEASRNHVRVQQILGSFLRTPCKPSLQRHIAIKNQICCNNREQNFQPPSSFNKDRVAFDAFNFDQISFAQVWGTQLFDSLTIIQLDSNKTCKRVIRVGNMQGDACHVSKRDAVF